VVVDIKQHRSQFKNSNFAITQSAKFFWHCVMVMFEFLQPWDIRGGVKFWVLPLKWLVTLTTVLHYRAACVIYCCCYFSQSRCIGSVLSRSSTATTRNVSPADGGATTMTTAGMAPMREIAVSNGCQQQALSTLYRSAFDCNFNFNMPHASLFHKLSSNWFIITSK